jgi:Tol biopolymer transport system component
MEATGENLRRVTDGGYHPSWSPDGKEIVFSSAGRDAPGVRNTTPSSLSIVNVETGARRLLTKSDAMQPAWSPGGNRIAFWFMPPASGRSDIATISKGGGEPVVVTHDSSTNWNPVWSPDGKFLYFASDRAGNMNFWRVAIDEETGRTLSEPEAVVTPSKSSRHLNFSRDGKRMIYVQADEQSNIKGMAFEATTEKLTGEPFWITRGDRVVILPDLSPDGKRFVMRLPGRNQEDLAVVDRDGTNWRDLTNDKFFDRYPRWSPDSKTIAFNSDRGGQYEIWTIDADGTNLKQITFDAKAGFPIWSPDGTRLMVRLYPANGIIDLSKSWKEQTPNLLPPVDDDGGVFVGWDWSPDGKKIAGIITSGGHNAMGYFSFETSRYEKLSDLDTLPRWLGDSRRVIFVNEDKVSVIDILTKQMRELKSGESGQIRSVGVSRDNKLLYYSLRAAENDIWMLELQ